MDSLQSNIITDLVIGFSSWIWGIPLMIILIGGGIFFFLYSEFIPFKYFRHSINILRGKHDDKSASGQISHYEALSTVIVATIGMGNISGVAIAISLGGPGVIFWMWVCAFIGMGTKFFTCSLAVMYRDTDENGQARGGPMYMIKKGLNKRWHFLAYFFCIACLFGCFPVFQANQLTQAVSLTLNLDQGVLMEAFPYGTPTQYIIGLGITVVVALVIFGGIKRISKVAAKLLPFMVFLYFALVAIILIQYITDVPSIFALIFTEAFNFDAIVGGATGSIIIIGVQRAAFSNEAGIGTAPMIHAETKTDEPIKEGLIAMLGPVVDTLLVCTLTALVILSTGVYNKVGDESGGSFIQGIALTLEAFKAIPGGAYFLCLCTVIFALTTLFSMSYLGVKSLQFLIGEKYGKLFNYIYIACIPIGCVSSLDFVVAILDSGFALMSIPTMLVSLLLAPKVKKRARTYFNQLKTARS